MLAQPVDPNIRMIDIVETRFNEQVRSIREKVFIEEQKVPVEEEFDELDAGARHWLALYEGEFVGTVRLTQVDRRLGRLAVLAQYRGKGIGKVLVHVVVKAAKETGYKDLKAWVQTWAAPWYEKQGFVVYGSEFDDAGIPHRKAKLVLLR